MSDLVIVESPSKAHTIKKYLGSGYEVLASKGHVRDLPVKRLGVDVKKDFEPKYEIMKDKTALVDELKAAVKKCDHVYLATDPDREGEAISWHLAYILGLPLDSRNRIEFNEITKTGVANGMANPRTIDIDLVNAQQARRVLDRLVGYKLSPFISQKIRRGLSAGRVQSVALRIIVDREEEIRKFVPEEYWTVDAKFMPKGSRKTFPASLYSHGGEKIKITNEEEANKVLKDLEGAEYKVVSVKNGTRKKQPAPPFITSTLQQDASRKLGFQSKRTMKVAQELYEGVSVTGIGATGLITYMRTDSLRVSDEAKDAAKDFILGKWGDKYLPKKPREYKSRNGAQDGHEAIRPTMIDLAPDTIKGDLTSDQYKLYKLIWDRFIASQMAECVQKTTQADIEGNGYVFRASGYRVDFDGFTVLYVEGKDTEDEKATELPPLEKDTEVRAKEITPNRHFTQPPARYTEASLIKALEENGIGRPSTYSATITTIVSRDYVKRQSKTLYPTELGEAITALMKNHFPKIVNVKFTAEMESELDRVETGNEQWVALLHTFYDDFSETLKEAKEEMKDEKIELEEDKTDYICENCGKPMVYKYGRYGRFIACSGWPECKTVKKVVEKLGIPCPRCGGDIIVRHTKKGKIFYGCGNYPNCTFASWSEPTTEICPNCGGMLFKKEGRKPKLVCTNEACKYEREIPRSDEESVGTAAK